MKKAAKFIFSFLAIALVFYLPLCYIENTFMSILFISAIVFSIFVYAKGLHRVDFDPHNKYQKAIFALIIVFLILFSFIVCALSIEKEWMYEYPLPGSVDDYGCYPQMFDAFQKGQLNIDTDYDLSILDSLENPYNYSARKNATGEKFGVFWDRAFFDGKLYSYFGAAPVIFLYYPVYFLTDAVLSDALAAAIIVAITCIFMMLLIWELCSRMEGKVPFILMILGGIATTFGSLLWSTETCANFYHLAVLSGICATTVFFYFVLRGEGAPDGIRRTLFFVAAGISVGAIVASRPNMALYAFIAFPLLINIIIKKPFGKESLYIDVLALCTPMFIMGGIIMWYNYARFGSVFDFGASYQLTLTDTSVYTLSPALFFPAMYHFFINPPVFDDVFPYLHSAVQKLDNYNVTRYLYISKTVGTIFFPTTWGSFLIPTIRKNKIPFITAIIAISTTIFLAFFDLCFGGVHLRYSADIMFILMLVGVYMLLYTVSRMKKGSFAFTAVYTLAIVLFALTVIIELPLCFDNERDMIMKYHREFYDFIAQ